MKVLLNQIRVGDTRLTGQALHAVGLQVRLVDASDDAVAGMPVLVTGLELDGLHDRLGVACSLMVFQDQAVRASWVGKGWWRCRCGSTPAPFWKRSSPCR